MLEKKYSIQPTVDVFVTPTESPEKSLITFHKMTTRERLEIVADNKVAEFLALLNGFDSTRSILEELGEFVETDAEELITFLTKNHLVVDSSNKPKIPARYSRQITYFDDMILDREGHKSQELISSKKVVILGCGSIGSQISEILLRAGVLNFSLVDHKLISKSNVETHLYARKSDVGQAKTQVLKKYLERINSSSKINCFYEQLLPNTDLSKWIDDETSLVINSCDEPYIGHTSLKIGRYLQFFNIPLYVAGGFDAHLMSSGELIYPPLTPCIDCAQKTFNLALNDWKPVYRKTDINPQIVRGQRKQSIVERSTRIDSSYLAGGPGGQIMMSGFSANLSAIKIIEFLAENSSFDFKAIRYEYLLNDGLLTEFEMMKQTGCNVCNA